MGNILLRKSDDHQLTLLRIAEVQESIFVFGYPLITIQKKKLNIKKI